MTKISATFAALLALVPLAAAQQSAWGQCNSHSFSRGGQGWTGPTTCVAGYTCTVSNPYYSQCIPGAGSAPGGGSPTSTAGGPGSTSTATINTVAKAAGKTYFGSATDNPELTDTAYVAILSDNTQFGQITPGNSMKWDATEPEQGVFTFTQGDAIANLAKGNDQLLRGHNCVWYNQLPSWVSSGNFNSSELTSIIQNHCSTVVGHYKGQAYSWDVVNEPFNDDGTWRTDVFYNTLGTTYVPIALESARQADPSTKVYINEYNLEYAGPKLTSMISLINSLKSAGTPLDGIGVQGHLIVGQVPTDLETNLANLASLGVEVAITELDIRMTLPSTDALLQQQKTDYQNVISACNAVKGCIGITIWDYTDKYSWVPSTFPGQGAACPWDDNLVKKPAFDGIIAGFS
ncbi:endo-1,4-beta-xylanase C precursor [Dentipellis sp. KUC8613]|nr:endo-1,4-beta-xylanase C precursor [Dentipellis sp. KUC8613]